MKKKELAIVLGITGNWAFALGNTLIGLKKHNPNLKADFIVYYDNISLKNRLALHKIYQIKFIKYNFPLDVSKICNINIFTQMTFARYECFNMLKKYKKTLWLDVDILIQKPILDLITKGEDGIAMYQYDRNLTVDFTQPIKKYDLSRPAYAAGTFVISDKLNNYNKMTRWCYEKTLEFAPILYCPDQAIMNILLQEFNIIPEKIEESYVFHPEKENALNAHILHAYCPKKFWSGFEFKEWKNNNDIWLSLGGSEYDPNWDYKSHLNFLKQPRKFIKDLIKRYII